MKNTETVKNKIIAFTDEVCSCDCCGKTDLKGTYVIENVVTGVTRFYGSVCAFKVFNLTAQELKSGVKEAEKVAIEAAKNELRETIEYKNYTQQMIDREPLLLKANRTNDDGSHTAIIKETIRLSNLLKPVKDTICKKYFIKKTYLVN